ncbi:unnamed protein product [Rhizophagus irregularis]|uniref:Uncharacterized protein n=1 Tax=Rhizophagus irregularis TaxID=588596 RepID=A0A2N1M7Z9_9GLOM|nr:hypothetical protein RhiirC2_858088 [Rhizophagus irregularis]CAB5381128.1 unnamed protein product [Rhizophagus irregularis]
MNLKLIREALQPIHLQAFSVLLALPARAKNSQISFLSDVWVDILSRLGMGVIGKDAIKGFYRGENLNSKNLEKIGA